MERLSRTQLRPSSVSRIDNAIKHLENPFLVEFKADLAYKQPQFQEDRELLKGATAALLLGENYPLGNEAGHKLLKQMDAMEGELLVRLAEFLEAQRAQWMAEKMMLQAERDKHSETAKDALSRAEEYQARMVQLDKAERELDNLRNLRTAEKRKLEEAEAEKADLLAIVKDYKDGELPLVEQARLELERARDEHWVALAELRRQLDAEKQEMVNKLEQMRREKHEIMQHDDGVIYKQADLLNRMNEELARAIGEAHWLETDNQRMYNALAAGYGNALNADKPTPRANAGITGNPQENLSLPSGGGGYSRVGAGGNADAVRAGPRGEAFWAELVPACIRSLNSVPLPPPGGGDEAMNTKITIGFEHEGKEEMDVNCTSFYSREMAGMRKAIAMNDNDRWISNEILDKPLLTHDSPDTGLTMWSPEGHVLIKKTSANYCKPLLSRDFLPAYAEYFEENGQTTFLPHIYWILKITIPENGEEAFFVISNNPVMSLRAAGLTARQRFYIRGNQSGGSQPNSGDDLAFRDGPESLYFQEQDQFLRGISLDLDFIQSQGLTDYGLLVALVETNTIPPLPRRYKNELMQGFMGEDAGGKEWGVLVGLLDVHNQVDDEEEAELYADNFFEAMEDYFPGGDEDELDDDT